MGGRKQKEKGFKEEFLLGCFDLVGMYQCANEIRIRAAR
jgi:hypothetical protein